jgi:hypothetical protein
MPKKGVFINTSRWTYINDKPQNVRSCTDSFSLRINRNVPEDDFLHLNIPNSDDDRYWHKPSSSLLSCWSHARYEAYVAQGDKLAAMNEVQENGDVKQVITSMGLADTVGPGVFGGLPYGTAIQDIHQGWWNYVGGNNEEGLTICRFDNPFEFYTNVNPNLGIRRCLKKFNEWEHELNSGSGGRSRWNVPVTFVLPHNAEQHVFSRILGEYIDKNDMDGLASFIDESFDSEQDYIGTDSSFYSFTDECFFKARTQVNERDEWDMLDGLCA